jgi:predicted nuclease with TOPRIM domain
VSLGSTLPKLLQIDGKSYEMKGKQKIGVLAQEIQEVFPELVSEDDNEMLAVNYQGLVPVLINALKEQDAKLNEQQSEIETYRVEVSELREMVQELASRD